MVKYELYINGQLCDLSEDSEVSLIYKSPLFSGLDAIQSNTSITLDLPMTAKNRKIVGFAMRPDVLQDEPYIKLPAELYANGVDLFRRGFAIIDEITEVIACTLVFGNIENFETLGETNLREMEPMGNESIPWNGECAWGDKSDSGIMEYIRADFGIGVVNPAGAITGQPTSMQYACPSVSVPAVISAIENECNVSFQYNPEYFDIQNMEIPLTKNSLVGEFMYIKVESVSNSEGVESWVENGDYINYRVLDFGGLYVLDSYELYDATIQIIEDRSAKRGQYDFLIVWGYDDNSESERVATIPTVPNGDYYKLSTQEFAFNAKGFKYLRFTDRFGFFVTFVVKGRTKEQKLSYPAKKGLFLYPNLPDQTCAEFLQNLMNMFGVFAQPVGENTVRLVHPSEIYRNIEEGVIYDWTKKLVINGDGNEVAPDGIRFYIDDWAQVTTIDYDNDDEVKESIDGGGPETAGTIEIDNKNIDEEGEVNIDFSASNMKNQHIYGGSESTKADVAVVPIWEAQEPDSDGNVEYRYSDVSPRILMFEYDAEDPEMSRLTFPETLRFGGAEGLVSRYYGDLKKIIDRAKVITVRIRLSLLDLRDLDFIKPVYLQQFGCYFAIYEINTSDTGISEVQLIKL